MKGYLFNSMNYKVRFETVFCNLAPNFPYLLILKSICLICHSSNGMGIKKVKPAHINGTLYLYGDEIFPSKGFISDQVFPEVGLDVQPLYSLQQFNITLNFLRLQYMCFAMISDCILCKIYE